MNTHYSIHELYLLAKHRKGINKRILHTDCDLMNLSYSNMLRIIENYQIDRYKRIIIL